MRSCSKRKLDLERKHVPLRGSRCCWLAARGMFTTDLATISNEHNRPGNNVKDSLLGLDAISEGADEALFNLARLC